MALTPRHRWCIERIKSCFQEETDVDDEKVQGFIRKSQVISKFNSLFAGDGRNAVFVHFQGTTSSSNGSINKPELCLTYGDSIPIKSKCCYFVRSGSAVDLNIQNDSALLYGEIGSSPLQSIKAILSSQYIPLSASSNDWGNVNMEQKDEFSLELNRFAHTLSNALESFKIGPQLRRSDNFVFEDYYSMDLKKLIQSIPDKAVFISHLEELLGEWCDEIESHLSPIRNEINIESSDILGRSLDVGPKGELNYWRVRMQTVTSITEQVKSEHCNQVVTILNEISKSPGDDSKSRILLMLRRWRQVDVFITETANEAKDNIKYLTSLQRFVEPFYNGSINAMVDAVPALLNSVKMIHTIARYYNTTETMTILFTKITDQMISNCKQNIIGGGDKDAMWHKDPSTLIHDLKLCLQLNEVFQEQYRLTKVKLQQMPNGKQFNCNEMQIFGKFDLFCRRVIKLIDLFTTIGQFDAMSSNKLEGMNVLIDHFNSIKSEFRARNHDLLDYHNNKFDRDYVEFNVHISDLETKVQQYVNRAFESLSSITHSLQLLKQFQQVLHRESLKMELDSKLSLIFQNYGLELEQVQQLYEKQKHEPPIPRNLPPVAGNITWSRHLLKRIEEPMKEFEVNISVMSTKDAKKVIKMYNKVARTLVAFEFLWYKAWVQSIDQAKTGLQATLIIRHPDDGKLYVNFDHEILQLIREAKCLDRMGIDIPEKAKITLYQEEKFKTFYMELNWALTEYDSIMAEVIPVTSMILRPHFNDMEHKLRPGMITLTWTSMNIESYINTIHRGLKQLRELVSNVNGIIENRIEKNLKIVSKTILIDLPDDSSFTVSDFVAMQKIHIAKKASILQAKNNEIESAVEDLVEQITSFVFESPTEVINTEDIAKLRDHYNHFMYKSLLNSAKTSMNALKTRIGSRGGTSIINSSKPFFNVDVQLMPPHVTLSPSLDQIQNCINAAAQTILTSYKNVLDWSYLTKQTQNGSFFDRITKDIELVRVALLLTGCIQGIRNTVSVYLDSFSKYDWLWKSNKDVKYKGFADSDPSLEDYELQLRNFGDLQVDIDKVSSIHVIGALSLNTKHLKRHLGNECDLWKLKYSKSLHTQAKLDLETLTEYARLTMGKLTRKVEDLDSLGFMMKLLKEVRIKEASIEMEMNPVMETYQLLENYLPSDFMDKDEVDQKTMLRSNWKKLFKLALSRSDELSKTQLGFKNDLLKDIKIFKTDISQFYSDFERNGPLVQGIAPMDAVDRLSRFKEELKIRQRKFELYRGGEEMFALEHNEYPEIEKAKKNIKIASQLFDLYVDVIRTINEWKQMPWNNVAFNIVDMNDMMESYAGRCKKLPGRLREFSSYTQLKKDIENFQLILPLLQELSKDSIKARHWDEVMNICDTQFEIVGNPDFKLQSLLDINLVSFKDEIEEVTDGADKQLKIEHQLGEINSLWQSKEFSFQEWKDRGIHVLKGIPLVMEELEESQMNLQTMLTMRHVVPFKALTQSLLGSICETSDTLELWVKVQMMWCALESVFTGGDIAKQMPKEAKKFAKVDKAWAKIMTNACECRNVISCCSDELLCSSLPTMYAELEKCQKSLEGYLEQKQNAFPRFYFVSNAKLLIILSQGSDPLAMNDYYENVFDAIQFVEHDNKDKTVINKIHGSGGEGHEVIPFHKPVKAVGNIENWLMDLLKNMRFTMKDLAKSCAAGIAEVQSNLSSLRPLVDKNIAQFALLAVQLMWTYETQNALENCQLKKNVMKENSQRQLQVLSEMSSWCLQDLGTAVNRKKIETLVTVHLHQRDIAQELMQLVRSKKVHDANDFDWLKQARFYWRPSSSDDVSSDGATVVSITDVDFNYQYEYLGSKERLVITPLTDKCYITLAQALGMYYGGAPAGPAGTGKVS